MFILVKILQFYFINAFDYCDDKKNPATRQTCKYRYSTSNHILKDNIANVVYKEFFQ